MNWSSQRNKELCTRDFLKYCLCGISSTGLLPPRTSREASVWQHRSNSQSSFRLALWWLNGQKYPLARVSRTIMCMRALRVQVFPLAKSMPLIWESVTVRLYVVSNAQAPVRALQLLSINRLSWWSEKDQCNNELKTAHTFPFSFLHQFWLVMDPKMPQTNWSSRWNQTLTSYALCDRFKTWHRKVNSMPKQHTNTAVKCWCKYQNSGCFKVLKKHWKHPNKAPWFWWDTSSCSRSRLVVSFCFLTPVLLSNVPFIDTLQLKSLASMGPDATPRAHTASWQSPQREQSRW